MTNALRGFNMSLTETNAQRVDDVYSELAANTASNVDEISTAMTKVASLANNANMEFETTAAFLAQIIETTRESAETAGTALKTVVARFSEVKKLVDEGTLRGQDEEGQVVDVNKVGAALRTAGIDLNKYFLGEVGLDDIFMELASKWDSLTSLQQRYIATQAAGSRQQSRFIALMSDYARTQELVGKAYNANGASARQFEKTQDSLESKLARLKNAWNEFLMGLTNNQMVKGFVDGLTNLLNFINKLTSGFDATTNSILKFGVALGGIFGARSLLSTGGLVDKGLMALLGGTGIGNALTKAGILPKVDGAAAAEGTVTRTPLIFGSGSLLSKAGKGLWNQAQILGLAVKGRKAGGLGAAKETFSFLGGNLGADATIAGLTGIGTALGAIAVAVGLVVAGYQAWLHLTPEGQLKQAEAIAEAMNATAANAQKAAEEMRNASESYKEYNNAIKNARTIEDRNEAIQNRNEYIQSLLEQNETLAEYVTASREDGQFTLAINEEQLAAAVKNASESATKAAISANFANALQAGKRADAFEARIQRARVDLEKRTKRRAAGRGNFIDQKLTNAEYAKYDQYAQAAAEQRSQQRSFATQAYLQDLVDTGLKDDVATMLAGALADTFDKDQYLKDINAQKEGWWIFGPTKQQLRDEYAGLYKTEADTTMDKEQLRKAVAQYYVDGKRSEDTKKIADLIASNEPLYNKILSAYSGQGQLATQNLLGLDIDNDADLAALLGLNNLIDGFNELEEIFGEGVLLNQIKKQAAEQKKYQEQAAKNATLQMIQNGGYTPQQMAQYLSLESFEDQSYINNLLTQLQDSNFGNEIISSILSSMSEGTWEDSSLQKWLNNIDFSNPIIGFQAIKKAAENDADPAIQNLAKSIQKNSDFITQFSNTAQVSYFLLSDSYNELSDSITGFIEENGSITASNIKELAESSKELNQLLKNGAISAKGLATILNGIESGKITVLNLNDAILAAVNSMDDLDSITKETIEDLNNFDPGYDENDITGFITKVLENATENINKGAWGNNVMANYMQKIFGDFKYDGPQEGYRDAYKAWLQDNVAWLNANKDNMFSAWDNFVGENNKRILESGNKTAEILEENGEIIIYANDMTTEELTNAIAKSGNLTVEQASMMVADFKNYSADFAHEMASNDLPNAIQAWYDALPTINGQKIYEESDLETLKTLLNVDDIQTAIDGLEQSAGQLTKIDWTGGTGKNSPEAYIKQLQQLGFELKSNFGTGKSQVVPEFDYDKIFNATSAAGIKDQFDTIFNGIITEGDRFTATISGDFKEIEVQAGESATDAYDRVVQELSNEQLAGEIGESVASALAELGDVEISFIPNSEKAETVIGEVNKDLDDLNTKTAKPSIKINDGASSTISKVSNALDELNEKRAKTYLDIKQTFSTEHAATGGIVKSYAKGSANNSLSPGFALTGEEGPEIIWNKNAGYAYITGHNGPEFQNLQPGDRVFNAAETSRIFRNSDLKVKGIFPSYSGGSGGSRGYGPDSGSISGSKNNKKDSTWRNELDWLYDLMEDIAEYERQQTILQSKYDIALKDITTTGRDLFKLTQKELINLKTQLDAQEAAQLKRLQQMNELQNQVKEAGYGKYIQYNQKDQTLEIDWDRIEAIQDKDTYDEITDWISRMENVQGQMDDAEKAIWDIRAQIQELQDRYLQSYLDFQQRVLDAVVKQYQDTIDNFSDLNSTLNDTNSAILDSIQKEIDLERQIRDNTDTEKNIADMEARLAYLQRDTTGANDVEIRQLQQELTDAREDYSDTLVDQSIDRLNEANDAAAKQREKQIELMQAQLDYWQESGSLWGEVAELISAGFTQQGTIIKDSDLWEILKNADSWNSLSEAQKKNWANELILETNEVGAHLVQLSGSNDINFSMIRDSIANVGGLLTQDIRAVADEVRSLRTALTGKLGGTPEHSYTTEKVEGYASGGLNTKTGPTMLHGTPSEPEYVLNARQTDAFLRLADVLPGVFNTSSTITNTYGGNSTFNIEVNVESISNDYDVDNLIARIKEDLYNATSYRNGNPLGFLR